MILKENILEQYKTKNVPFTELGEFVFYRTYSRWMPDKARREFWRETILRAINYNFDLLLRYKKDLSVGERIEIEKEALKLYDDMFNLRTFLSGRTLWIGGTEASYKYPAANFNCAFLVLEDFKDFEDLFYLLMVGAGVGFRILKSDIEKFTPYRTDIELIIKDYIPVEKQDRIELTELEVIDDVALIHVGDSKEGWVEALGLYFRILTSYTYKKVKAILIDFDNVRPKGEKLKIFGGTASGPESLMKMFEKIDNVLKQAGGKVKPITALDIANIIGENVVSGGVRRTSEICLSDDEEVLNAKKNIYYKDENDNWCVNEHILHRQVSNNSIYFTKKPTREELHNILMSIKNTGEPGFINAVAASKRRKDFEGVNPCGEILLKRKQTCNLTTTNVRAFVNTENNVYTLDKDALFDTIRRSVRAGIRMTLVELELPIWSKHQKDDRLVGVSLTGWQDAMDILGYDREKQRELLRQLREVAHNEADNYSNYLGINRPLLVTTIKPEGTISQLPTVSSGLHYSHSKYYIRRVRISSTDPLCKAVENMRGWSIKAEVGQQYETAYTKVVEFPVYSGASKTKYDITAIEQLENYKMFMEEYVDHNASITVTVRDHEWNDVEQWLWDNWDIVVGITFLSLDDSVYALAPYEETEENFYNKMKSQMVKFNPNVLAFYEQGEELEIDSSGCENGVCPVR